jgi:hypothetical protein
MQSKNIEFFKIAFEERKILKISLFMKNDFVFHKKDIYFKFWSIYFELCTLRIGSAGKRCEE